MYYLLHFYSLYRGLAANDYVELIWTTFAEFPGTILAFFLIDWIGRKKTLAILGFIFAASTLGIMECSASKNVLIMLLFCSRGAATGLLMVINQVIGNQLKSLNLLLLYFQGVYVYTPESYPTNLRALAIGRYIYGLEIVPDSSFKIGNR